MQLALNPQVSPPVAKKSSIAVLRARTGSLHARLEASVDLVAALNDKPSYCALLSRYLVLHGAFESALERLPEKVREIRGSSSRSRVRLLHEDLRQLGVSGDIPMNFPMEGQIPRLDDVDSLLGACYVVEGSNLGGRVLYRAVTESLGIDAASGASFLYGDGEQTGVAWKQFVALLEERIEDPERAADAACAMFEAFESVLSMRDADCVGDKSVS